MSTRQGRRANQRAKSRGHYREAQKSDRGHTSCMRPLVCSYSLPTPTIHIRIHESNYILHLFFNKLLNSTRSYFHCAEAYLLLFQFLISLPPSVRLSNALVIYLNSWFSYFGKDGCIPLAFRKIVFKGDISKHNLAGMLQWLC